MNELELIDEGENFKPRSYQDQLIKIALKENVIVYLPTGAGKTFIALMAMREMSKDLVGTIAEGGKRSVFLCNTIALARQQYDVIRNFTNLKCGVYTGDMNVDNWKRDKWEIELNKYQVYVATCQIIVDIIRHNFISLYNFNLMIFDECHHATGGHPMHQLMQLFQDADQKRLPKVIGLTGLLITSSRNTIIQELNNLEAVLRSRIITVENVDEFKNVLIYSTKPKEILLSYSDNPITTPITQKIVCLVGEIQSEIAKWKIDETHLKYTKNLGDIRKQASPTKKVYNILNDFIYQLEDLGLYGASIGILCVLVDIELKKRAAETITHRNMLRTVIGYAERIRHIIVNHIDHEFDEAENISEIILQTSSQKVQKLLMYLSKTFEGKESNDVKCLLFVQRRVTAKILYHIIKRFMSCPSQKDVPIIPDFMVGSHEKMPESIEYILEDKQARNVLNNFKRNECNLIVASSVLEEGIDVQSCNYVIVFDVLLTFRSYVQTKGRARMNDSIYNIMLPESKKSDLVRKIVRYKEIDEKLKEYLVGKTIDRKPPLEKEIKQQFEVVIPPFVNEYGAKLEAESAVALINRYCNTLPTDSFAIPSIQYSKEVLDDGKMIVKMILPVQSSIKDEICSDPMINAKWGKRSAAFKACKMLYEKGEFSRHLLPITQRQCLENMKPVYFGHWDNYKEENVKICGTNKNRRVYDIQYPGELFAAMPQPFAVSYMYVIYLIPEFERNSDNDHVHDLLSTKNNFAILTAKPLPKIAEMPLFMTQGSLTSQISPNAIEVNIGGAEDLERLRNFHIMIFRDLINYTWCRYFAQDYENNENSFLIVPTKNSREINWDIVNNFQNLTNVRKISEIQRRKMPIREEDYLNNIVCTWYTADDTVRYVVKSIRNDLTPLSPFPSQKHSTFADYVEDKYKEKVIRNDTFLIEVHALTQRSNFLIGSKLDGSKKKMKKYETIILIPEMCHNFQFPGDLWLKARFLPSVLHRLHYILLAEEIRIQINKHLKIIHENYNPKSLIVDMSLPRVNNNDDKSDKEVILLPSLTSDAVAKPIKTNMSIVEHSKYKWREFEEPCDMQRYLDNLYQVELDYYHQFIMNKVGDIKISDYDSSQFDVVNVKSKSEDKKKSNGHIEAICDVPLEERRKIHILSLTGSEKRGLEQCDLVASLTTAGANDVFDMERTEVLGDSFLKLSISLYLLHRHPKWNEGFLTVIKSQLVSNRNLLYHAISKKLPGALKTRSFNPGNDWRPPITSVPKSAFDSVKQNNVSPSVFSELELCDEEVQSGKLTKENEETLKKKFADYISDKVVESDMSYLINQVWMSDKVCADAMESLLGVCVSCYGVRKTFPMLQFFEICEPNINLENLLNINLGSPQIKPGTTSSQIDSFLLNYKELEKNLGYTFRDRAYLLQALTHPSYLTNRLTECYQQYEFIGDAVLDFLVTCYIYERCTNMNPGKLTDLRSAVVNNVTLASITVRHKFHLFLLMQSASLSQSIKKFVEFQNSEGFRAGDQLRILLLENESKSSLAEYIDVPKALGDLFEALIGAVFLDSGNDLVKTWNVIYDLINQELSEFMVDVPIEVTRQLYEYRGADPLFSDAIFDDDVCMVNCTFTCRNEKKIVSGFGKNKSQAKKSAAKVALQHLYQA